MVLSEPRAQRPQKPAWAWAPGTVSASQELRSLLDLPFSAASSVNFLNILYQAHRRGLYSNAGLILISLLLYGNCDVSEVAVWGPLEAGGPGNNAGLEGTRGADTPYPAWPELGHSSRGLGLCTVTS